MKKKHRATEHGFSRQLAQEFLLLRRSAEEKADARSVDSLNIVIDGIMELSLATAEGRPNTLSPLSSAAHGLFSQLAADCNDPDLLKRAGMHYLVEWQLPHSALSHFQRASDLGGNDKKLPMLIDIAAVAVERQNEKTASGRVALFATPGKSGLS